MHLRRVHEIVCRRSQQGRRRNLWEQMHGTRRNTGDARNLAGESQDPSGRDSLQEKGRIQQEPGTPQKPHQRRLLPAKVSPVPVFRRAGGSPPVGQILRLCPGIVREFCPGTAHPIGGLPEERKEMATEGLCPADALSGPERKTDHLANHRLECVNGTNHQGKDIFVLVCFVLAVSCCFF